MDARLLLDTARTIGLEFPGSVVDHPFGEDVPVLRVRDKIFALLFVDVHGRPGVNLKVEPQDGEAVKSMYPEVEPGYHMNKKHWVSVYPGETVTESVLRDLVLESYCLVVAGLPKKDRPVDPATFGRATEWEKEPGE
ncbi:MmcQ/YjbR family DNA-binding protein [Brevibacterium litoralis]|uniref:MmcQ/YjbR family DNA-binding protein n=1 Tax=Brevibacterium litoralis TaxID=3138935 RepID=UPI0032EEDA35